MTVRELQSALLEFENLNPGEMDTTVVWVQITVKGLSIDSAPSVDVRNMHTGIFVIKGQR